MFFFQDDVLAGRLKPLIDNLWETMWVNPKASFFEYNGNTWVVDTTWNVS